MENNSSGGFMFPFITGIITGAVLGILFAPDKGTETRKKLMSTVGDLTDTFNETIGSVSNGSSESGSGNQYAGQSAGTSSGTSRRSNY